MLAMIQLHCLASGNMTVHQAAASQVGTAWRYVTCLNDNLFEGCKECGMRLTNLHSG